MHTHNDHSKCSGCCGARALPVTRRQFLAGAGAITLGGAMLHRMQTRSVAAAPLPTRDLAQNTPLRMQPVLVYQLYQRREATSWRGWSGLITEEHVREELQRIEVELESLSKDAEFPLELLPLKSARSVEEAQQIAADDHDGVIMYGASGGMGILAALANPDKWNLMFVRHRTGPAYLWYEIVHPHFLRHATDTFQHPGGMHIDDVVVDDYGELLWRLRALHGLKNTKGKRIVAIGGALGWDRGHHSEAPERACELWDLDIVEVMYDEMSERIQAARAKEALVAECADRAHEYLEQPGVTLLPLQEQLTTEELIAGYGSPETLEQMREFVVNAFVLTEVFRDLMEEHQTDAITVGECMTSIIPMSETTACLSLTLLNDEGCLAFCESDFVVIPSGILLHYIAGKPVFFCNPTYPYNNTVTVAHCTGPRKMDGKNLEPMKVRTHFESDYGAAPKVEMRPGQDLTVLVPNFASTEWIGFEGSVLENPALDICTTQMDVQIHGDCAKLLEKMGGFHWMTCYGNYLRETGYVLAKSGVDWLHL